MVALYVSDTCHSALNDLAISDTRQRKELDKGKNVTSWRAGSRMYCLHASAVAGCINLDAFEKDKEYFIGNQQPILYFLWCNAHCNGSYQQRPNALE